MNQVVNEETSSQCSQTLSDPNQYAEAKNMYQTSTSFGLRKKSQQQPKTESRWMSNHNEVNFKF